MSTQTMPTSPILRTESRFYVGLDLGQRRDFTAIAVLHHATRTHEARNPATLAHLTSTALTVRYLERIPLGTLYPDVVARVRQLLNQPELKGPTHLIVDETGVGIPVVDHLRRARLNCRLEPFTIGESSRRHLLHNLQFLFEQNRLRFAANLPMLSIVMEELRHLHDRRTPHTLAPSRPSAHDDLAFALALAAWPLRTRAPIGHQAQSLPGFPSAAGSPSAARLAGLTPHELRTELRNLLEAL
jgi:phage FluMu gp28-like protein